MSIGLTREGYDQKLSEYEDRIALLEAENAQAKHTIAEQQARIAELERMNATRQDIIEILESRQNLPQEDKPQ